MATKKPVSIKSIFYTAVSLVWIFGLSAIGHITMVLIEKYNPAIKYDFAWWCAITGFVVIYLTRFLSAEYSGKQITLVAGILDDKSYRSMLKTILPLCHQVILTQPRIDRSLPPEKLAREAKKIISRVSIITNVVEALKKAITTAGPNGVVCAAGSLYVIGEIKEAIEKGLFPFEEEKVV